MSLDVSPSPLAVEPNTTIASGRWAHCFACAAIRAHSRDRIEARASTAQAARCLRLSVKSDADPAGIRSARPAATSSLRMFATRGWDTPGLVSSAIFRPVSGVVVDAGTRGPGRGQAAPRQPSDWRRSTLLQVITRSNM